MQEHTEAANGADKINGALDEADASVLPAKERPRLYGRGVSERASDAGIAALEGLRGFSVSPGTKLQASTRVVNAFVGYLVGHCGRAPDQMNEVDVACLGGIMASLERLEVNGKRQGYAS